MTAADVRAADVRAARAAMDAELRGWRAWRAPVGWALLVATVLVGLASQVTADRDAAEAIGYGAMEGLFAVGGILYGVRSIRVTRALARHGIRCPECSAALVWPEDPTREARVLATGRCTSCAAPLFPREG